MLDAGDDFQAATHSALTGFYRLSLAALRSALELTTIGACGQVCGNGKQFRDWRAGSIPLSFGQACDSLLGATQALSTHLSEAAGYGLFEQRTSTTEGGHARRTYAGLSEFSHARPGFADSDFRKSNGPIYVRSAFNHVAWVQFETLGLCFVLLMLARPKLSLPPAALELFGDVRRVKSRATRAAFQFLHSS
jgi:hypothetical protein